MLLLIFSIIASPSLTFNPLLPLRDQERKHETVGYSLGYYTVPLNTDNSETFADNK